MSDPSFSLKDFRNWLSSNSSDISLTGLSNGNHITVRLSEENMIKNLLKFNKLEENEIKEVCSLLKEHGGIIKEIKGANAKIKVSGGDVKEVYIPRLFLRRSK